MSQERTISPAYVGFSTFKTAITNFTHDGKPPRRVDASVLLSLNGSTRSQFIGALRYLDLITSEGAPTPLLNELCAAIGKPEWKVALRRVLQAKYAKQLEVLKDGTESYFKESFADVPSSIIIPAARFLLTAAREADLPVSKNITEIRGGKPQRKTSPKDNGIKPTAAPPQPATSEPQAVAQPAFRDKLLEKFPPFDPAWDEERQKAWFSAFEKFLAMTGGAA